MLPAPPVPPRATRRTCAAGLTGLAWLVAGLVFLAPPPAEAAPAPSWSAPLRIDGVTALTGISCATTTLCVAVDSKGHALVSTNPTEGPAANWSKSEIDGTTALTGISCATTTPCVAVDGSGNVLASANPAAGGWPSSPRDAGLELVSVACAGAPASVCVAMDSAGDALASANPTAPAPTWNWTPIPALSSPTAVSCAAAGLCVTVDGQGNAFVSDDPTSAILSWEQTPLGPPNKGFTGVSCVSQGLCAAVGGEGQVLVAQVPAPAVASSPPSGVTETAATLAGTVNPEDATLTGCRFEYGASAAYGHSAPCATPLPPGGDAAQAVSAPLSGLRANTTYHYRLLAESASGASMTADATFKTPAPALVQPHPSISGLPARGQRLMCKSGVTASGATLTYAWLRNTKAISGANGSTYVVGSADVSQHLQCRVTATNAGGSASATSGFVTIPAGGLGSIAETAVGAPSVAGAAVSVPLTCSRQAAGSCTIRLSLTVVETLHGNRVVAVAAARTRRATVTVGALTVRLAPGQRRTVTVALNATGRRLLARTRRMAVRLSVSGTVVGAIKASLESATLTLTAPARASSHKASSRTSPHKASSRRSSPTASSRTSPHKASSLTSPHKASSRRSSPTASSRTSSRKASSRRFPSHIASSGRGSPHGAPLRTVSFSHRHR
ncbi:MAG TPA: hypothetical protein VNY52_13615 [Solirubrobacteraceae bacterium]|nr:hypothetical protein [Solirubrobacteraceae bacterium]